MKRKNYLSVYTVCDKDTEGAIPLYDKIGKNEKVCCYAVKAPYKGDQTAMKKYILRQSDTSGGGDSFGSSARHTDYEYSFTVYPFDGTSSEYSRSKYTQFLSEES